MLQGQTRGQYAIAVGNPGLINMQNLVQLCSGRVGAKPVTFEPPEPIALSGDPTHVVQLGNYMQVVNMIQQQGCQPIFTTTTTQAPPQFGADVIFAMSTAVNIEGMEYMVS